MDLIKKVFTPKILALTKSEADIKKALDKLDQSYSKQFLGGDADNNDLYAFATPFGQVFFYWLYQALNLELIAAIPHLIEDVNKVKEVFAKTLGDSKARAAKFKQKIMHANAKVVFVQEADTNIVDSFLKHGDFLPLLDQNPKDGTLVFLKSDFWEPNYEIIPLTEYAGYKDGVVNAILAAQKNSGQKFLLAACHGNSTKSEDGRAQITALNKKLEELIKEKGEDIKLLIGTDANTKSKEDVELFKKLLHELGLLSTSVGPTTIKKRMVTVQHAKAGKSAVDEEDYLIVRKDQLTLINPTVGFSENKPDINTSLPNLSNQSDHYAVGALVIKK